MIRELATVITVAGHQTSSGAWLPSCINQKLSVEFLLCASAVLSVGVARVNKIDKVPVFMGLGVDRGWKRGGWPGTGVRGWQGNHRH